MRVILTLPKKADPAEALLRLMRFVRTSTVPSPSAFDVLAVRNAFGFLLGIVPWPPDALSTNIYGYAFSLGRARQLGIEPEALDRQLEDLSGATLKAAAGRIFADGNSAVVIAGR